jgi:hypothetical protein
MSDKYKIIINPELPSDKEIDDSKDFAKVLSGLKANHRPSKVRRKMHRNRKMMMMFVTLIAVALAVWCSTV